MEFEKGRVANAFALTTVVIWIVCSVVVWLFPGFSMLITKWWMHGMEIGIMGEWNLTLYNFIMGGLTLGVSFWIIGWIFGWAWEKVGGKR
jgi:hypothetical protein